VNAHLQSLLSITLLIKTRRIFAPHQKSRLQTVAGRLDGQNTRIRTVSAIPGKVQSSLRLIGEICA